MQEVKSDRQKTPLFDWGNYEQLRPPTLLDTTLRDGIQSLLHRYPSLDEKLHLLDKLIDLGIEAFDIGFPGANSIQKQHTLSLVKHAAGRKAGLRLSCLARARAEDVRAVADLSDATGVKLEALIFVGSSPIRLLVEQWDLPEMVNWVTRAVDEAIKAELSVNFACEDATRSEPGVLRTLYTTALDHGATRLTIPDTAGVCNALGATRIVKYLRHYVIRDQPVGLDWHGHNDRGLAVANALTAAFAGVDCLHTTVLGIGERCGNVPLEPLLANLHYLCGPRYRLEGLSDLAGYANSIFGEPIPAGHPVIGRNAFSTAAGIHGAAILKAQLLRQADLAANVYAGVDPRLVNRQLEIMVGPFSGAANVEWKAAQLGLTYSEGLARRVLAVAREAGRVLTGAEILEISKSFNPDQSERQ
jgi:2-isopropylmalate synthase